MASTSLSIPASLVGLSKLPPQSKIGLLVIIAAIAALAIGSWMWSQVPDYRTLYANVSDQDGGAIIAALDQMNIPHKFSEGGGAIMVPEQMVHEARLKLASQGLPKGSGVGFDLMDNQKFGTTQFQEQVNYQRALEGELARTIQTLSAVASARVHLAIPRPSVFLRDAQEPSASVVVALHPGRNLDASQVAGIVHLVASSVPAMSPQMVSVIDERGTLLSGANDGKGEGGLDPSQLSYVSDIESGYTKRIIDMIEPIVGRANVRAQVTADVDFSQSESTAELYKPNQTDAAVRSQQVSEDGRGGGAGANGQGVPGALTNQPAAPATAPINGPSARPGAPSAGTAAGGGAAATAQQASGHRDSTVNYEVDKTVQRVKSPTGNIKRLSAAVVVNFRQPAPPAADKDGKPAPKSKPTALSPQEMQQITDLVKETIGFSDKRGDSVNVQNVVFDMDDAVEAAPPVPLWQQPDNIALAKQVGRDVLIGVIALYLFLGVLRPMLRQLAASVPQAEPLAPEQLAQFQSEDGAAASADNLQGVRQLARNDPKVVANVVRGWVNADG